MFGWRRLQPTERMILTAVPGYGRLRSSRAATHGFGSWTPMVKCAVTGSIRTTTAMCVPSWLFEYAPPSVGIRRYMSNDRCGRIFLLRKISNNHFSCSHYFGINSRLLIIYTMRNTFSKRYLSSFYRIKASSSVISHCAFMHISWSIIFLISCLSQPYFIQRQAIICMKASKYWRVLL